MSIKTINYEKSNLSPSLPLSLSHRVKSSLSSNSNSSSHTTRGFTIVELLVVIVVIGILAAITIVSYTGITSKATVASLQSDLGNASKQLGMYYTEYGSYPTTLDGSYCPTAPTYDIKYCLKPTSDTTFTYSPNSATTASDFSLYADKSGKYLRVTADSGISTTLTKTCPYGFIVVPGSSTYGTSDFCVMKYEAKADNGSGIGDTTQDTGYHTWPANTHPISSTRKLVSTPRGYPVANISQTTAITAVNTNNYVTDCSSGCHIITEAEWMTIAQNVLSVASNWSSGTVGTGHIYSGHNDNGPNMALEASDDNNGYYGTGQTSGNQKRSLTLTNGETIWDLAGNVWEWTASTTTGGQPGITGEGAFAWKEWTAVNAPGSLTVPVTPASTGLSGSSSWYSGHGVGLLYSYVSDASLRGFVRGSTWNGGGLAGVLSLSLGSPPGSVGNNFGLRVSR